MERCPECGGEDGRHRLGCAGLSALVQAEQWQARALSAERKLHRLERECTWLRRELERART